MIGHIEFNILVVEFIIVVLLYLDFRVWINFSMAISEKKWSAECNWGLGKLWFPPCSRFREEPCWETRKIKFWLLKSLLTSYLFTFQIKFSAVWGIFV